MAIAGIRLWLDVYRQAGVSASAEKALPKKHSSRGLRQEQIRNGFWADRRSMAAFVNKFSRLVPSPCDGKCVMASWASKAGFASFFDVFQLFPASAGAIDRVGLSDDDQHLGDYIL